MRHISRRAALAGAFAATAARAQQPGDLVSAGPIGTIPFTHDGGLIVVDISVNGQSPAPFLFDTGATITVLDSQFAAQAGLHPIEPANATGIQGGNRLIGMLPGLRLNAAGIGLPSQMAAALPFPNHITDRGLRPRLAGLIGLSAFGADIIRIDILGRQLSLLPPDQAPDEAGIPLPLSASLRLGGVNPLAPSWNHATIAANLDGMDIKLLLDSGAGSGVVLRDECVRGNNLLSRYGKHIDLISPGGIDGPASMSVAFGQTLQTGSIKLPQPELSLLHAPPPQTNDAAPTGRFADFIRLRSPARHIADGVLGLGIFAPDVLFLDLLGPRLIVEPRASKRPPPMFRSAGLSLDKPAHDYFKVLSVIPGTAAAEAGLQEGAIIVAVNGKPATDLALFDYRRLQAAGPITIRLNTGVQHTLAARTLLP